MVEGLRLGTIDVICANAPNAAAFIPELGLFSVAYLFKDIQHFERVVNDPKFVQRMESGASGTSASASSASTPRACATSIAARGRWRARTTSRA